MELIKIAIVSEYTRQSSRDIKKLIFDIKNYFNDKDLMPHIYGIGRSNIQVDRNIQKYSLDLGLEYSEYTTTGDTLYSINRNKMNMFRRNIILASVVDIGIFIVDNKGPKTKYDANLQSLINEFVKRNKKYIFR